MGNMPIGVPVFVWFHLPGWKKWVIVFFGLLFYVSIKGQEPSKDTVIDIAKLMYSSPLKEVFIFEEPDDETLDRVLAKIFLDKNGLAGGHLSGPMKIRGQIIGVRLSLENSSDTLKEIYFYPGIQFTKRKVFEVKSEYLETEQIPARGLEAEQTGPYNFAFLPVPPKKKTDFIIFLTPLKSGTSIFLPEIINKNFLPYYEENLKNRPINVVYYFVSGIILMMVFYALILYLRDFNSAFISYTLFAFFTGLLFFLKSFLYNSNLLVNYYFEGWFDFILQGIGAIFYIQFIRSFLQTSIAYPFPEKVFKWSQRIILLFLLSFSAFYFFVNNYLIPSFIESSTKLLLLSLILFFICYWKTFKNEVIRFLIIGQSMLLMLAIVSFILDFFGGPLFKTGLFFINQPSFFYAIGVTLELLFFLIAMEKKNKMDLAESVKERERLQLDNQRKELEKKLAVMEAKSNERSRIATDMHDELGANVSIIRMMSEIMKLKISKMHLPEMDKLSKAAAELLDKMNAIIWAMADADESVESLIAYIRSYTVELFDKSSIACKIDISHPIPYKELSGQHKRNIFLVIKESLNNVLKHSGASEVRMRISAAEKLMIEVCDNGKGIDLQNLREFGNGIKNMKRRMEQIGGKFFIENANGTRMKLEVQL